MNDWVVYILECKDNTLYTGITNNLSNRIIQHENSKGAKYTKGRSPLKLVYKEIVDNKSNALKRELELKRLKRIDKLKLIKLNKINLP